MKTAGLLRLAPLVLLAACGSDKTVYSYAKVHVKIDSDTVNDDRRRGIIACGVNVTLPNDAVDQFTLPSPPCTKGEVPYDLGAFRYTTDSEMGDIAFKVSFKDIARKLVAEGTGTGTITAKGTVEVDIVAIGTPEPDAGT